jgi:hypothetical protein
MHRVAQLLLLIRFELDAEFDRLRVRLREGRAAKKSLHVILTVNDSDPQARAFLKETRDLAAYLQHGKGAAAFSIEVEQNAAARIGFR